MCVYMMYTYIIYMLRVITYPCSDHLHIPRKHWDFSAMTIFHDIVVELSQWHTRGSQHHGPSPRSDFRKPDTKVAEALINGLV